MVGVSPSSGLISSVSRLSKKAARPKSDSVGGAPIIPGRTVSTVVTDDGVGMYEDDALVNVCVDPVGEPIRPANGAEKRSSLGSIGFVQDVHGCEGKLGACSGDFWDPFCGASGKC